VSVTASYAKDQLASLLERTRVGGERIVIEKHGKPAAALVSVADLERLERLDERERAAEHNPLAGSVRRFVNPVDSVASQDWDATA
jgi:prevent-host-death family protein